MLTLIRVRYGRKGTAPELREYQVDGVGPVGCLGEYKEIFPATFENDHFIVILAPRVEN